MIRYGLAALTFVALIDACTPDETVSGYALGAEPYLLTEFNGAAPDFEASLAFPEPGKVAGEGPCNLFNATQAAPYPWIEIRQIASTRRGCPDLEAEGEYFRLLEAMQFAEVSGPLLLLSNDAGETLEFRYSN